MSDIDSSISFLMMIMTFMALRAELKFVSSKLILTLVS